MGIRICEIYRSKQGEGRLTGTESWFVRTSGCNLRCWFCDTPFSSWEPEGETMSVEQIMAKLGFDQARHIVLTGGEPMLPNEIQELTRQMKLAGFHITIETAGTIFRDVNCDLMSISPKLSNSTPDTKRAGQWSVRHEQRRHQPDVIRQLVAKFDYQFKFVVDQPNDLPEIEQYLEEFSGIRPENIHLMPQGTNPAELELRRQWLEPHCDNSGYQYCPRMHIKWYGNKRGT